MSPAKTAAKHESTEPVFDFNSATTRYDPKNAYWLARAAELAYRGDQVVQEQAAAWELDQFRFFSRRETQAFVAGNDELIIIAFRGTEPSELQDWMTDADIILKSGPTGKVHDGFQRALGYVYSEIRQTIGEFQTNAQSLWVTGHSLGAALAALTVARLRFEEDKPVYGLYTYGQPRTGDRDFERNFNLDFKSKAFRFVNNNDIVPRVPPREFSYSHVGSFIYIDGKGKLHTDSSFWYKLLDRIQGRIEDLGKPGTDGIKDHAIANYVKHLGSNIKTVLTF